MLYISVETFGAFAFTCLVIELTPGPNMAYLAVLSAGMADGQGLPQLSIALGLLRDSAPAVARASGPCTSDKRGAQLQRME